MPPSSGQKGRPTWGKREKETVLHEGQWKGAHRTVGLDIEKKQDKMFRRVKGGKKVVHGESKQKEFLLLNCV